MAKFVEMPHGYAFDLEQVLYYQILNGDSYNPEYEYEPRNYKPVKLILHFKNGDDLKIPDFEEHFIHKWFYPAIRELEKRVVDEPVSIPQGEDFTNNSGVYFIQGEITKRIKIGHSDDIKGRIKSLEGSEPLRLIHVIPNATTKTELSLHKKFSHLRVIGEWFEGTQELAHYISSLKSDKITTVLH